MPFSVATWNVERPSVRSWKKLPAIRGRIAAVNADVWVLTESRTSIAPGDDYLGIHSPPHPPRRSDPDERWVSIWSRLPMERVSVRPSLWSATALIDTDLGRVLVHGVVLPFHAEPNPDGGPVLAWSEFRKELARQATDWGDLRRMYPDAPVVVAGDLNQNLDGARWYGTVETRGLLRLALDGAGLTCLTTEDAVLSGQLKFDHLVDHICVSPGLSESSTVEIWERVSFDGVRMSDHAGVAARFRANGAG
jgi:hypothetical protein